MSCSCLTTSQFMCLSTYWQWTLANERARISAVVVKILFVASSCSHRKIIIVVYYFAIIGWGKGETEWQKMCFTKKVCIVILYQLILSNLLKILYIISFVFSFTEFLKQFFQTWETTFPNTIKGSLYIVTI